MYQNSIHQYFGIDAAVLERAANAEAKLEASFAERALIKSHNFYKVLAAMQKNGLSDRHFDWKTGYGYDDVGRDIVEAIYSDIFKTEDALVRTQIVNGTHALSLSLRAILKNGDELLAISGKPYDTILETIGIGKENPLSLIANGVTYNEIALKADGSFDIETIIASIIPETKLIYIQRSSGYAFRPALTIDEIERVIKKIKAIKPDIIVMVDNCYGEFVEAKEPTEVGANIIAGSLIKNVGGGLALSGGYLAGDKEIIERASEVLTAIGIGKECGLTFGQTRTILQGLFFAPQVVDAALRSAMFAAQLFEDAGFEVTPKPTAKRSDIIQAILLGDKEKVVAFCEAIQAASPVDSFVKPQAWAMPGYDCDVVMAAGGFVAGSSIELSADAPIREPYAVYLQGGLCYEHGKLGSIQAFSHVFDDDNCVGCG